MRLAVVVAMLALTAWPATRLWCTPCLIADNLPMLVRADGVATVLWGESLRARLVALGDSVDGPCYCSHDSSPAVILGKLGR